MDKRNSINNNLTTQTVSAYVSRFIRNRIRFKLIQISTNEIMGLEIHILANIYIGQLEHSKKSYFVSRLKPEVMVVKHSILEQN